MKKYISIIGGVFCAGIIFLSSCTKMDHYYKDYVVERTYIGKPDSIWIQPGNLRVRIGMLTPKDPAAQKLVVRWSDADSVLLTIDHQAERNFIVIDNLQEQDYVFDAYTIDGSGNRSLVMELTSRAFGSAFEATMRERTLSHSVLLGDSVALIWDSATLLPETLQGNDVEFTDRNGQTQQVFVPRTAEIGVLHDADPTKPITIKSVYSPHENAFEYFYTPTENRDLIALTRQTLTFSSVSYTDAMYVDFHYIRAFLEENVPAPKGQDIDMAYALGAGSRGNLFTMDGTGFSSFAASWQTLINSWTTRNTARMKLNRGASAVALYEGLDEANRSQMIAAFNDSAAAESTRLSSLAVDDVILLHSSDRDIYVAMKVIGTPPPVSGALGDFTIEFKVSRP